jgi:uncharacterized protein YecA (UPF0149 family)
MVSAIRAQLPTPWQYNLKNYKSQDILDRKFEIYPETWQIDQPVWGTELKKVSPVLFFAAGDTVFFPAGLLF